MTFELMNGGDVLCTGAEGDLLALLEALRAEFPGAALRVEPETDRSMTTELTTNEYLMLFRALIAAKLRIKNDLDAAPDAARPFVEGDLRCVSEAFAMLDAKLRPRQIEKATAA